MAGQQLSAMVNNVLESGESDESNEPDSLDEVVDKYERDSLEEENVDIRYKRDSSYKGSDKHSGDFYEPEIENDDYSSVERFLEGIKTTGKEVKAQEIAIDKEERKARITYSDKVIDYEILGSLAGTQYLHRKEEISTGDQTITSQSLIELVDGEINNVYNGSQDIPVFPNSYNIELIHGAIGDVLNAEDKKESAIISEQGEFMFEYGESLIQQLGLNEGSKADIDRGKAEKLVSEIEDETGVICTRLENLELIEGCIQDLIQSKSDDNLRSLGVGLFEEKNIGDKADRLYIADGTKFDGLEDNTMYGLKVSVNKNGNQQEIIDSLLLGDIEELVKSGDN